MVFAHFVDAPIDKVVIPAGYLLDSIPVYVDRRTKESTLVASVAADGAQLKTLIVVQRREEVV
jgi:hypothetical protein